MKVDFWKIRKYARLFVWTRWWKTLTNGRFVCSLCFKIETKVFPKIKLILLQVHMVHIYGIQNKVIAHHCLFYNQYKLVTSWWSKATCVKYLHDMFFGWLTSVAATLIASWWSSPHALWHMSSHAMDKLLVEWLSSMSPSSFHVTIFVTKVLSMSSRCSPCHQGACFFKNLYLANIL